MGGEGLLKKKGEWLVVAGGTDGGGQAACEFVGDTGAGDRREGAGGFIGVVGGAGPGSLEDVGDDLCGTARCVWLGFALR